MVQALTSTGIDVTQLASVLGSAIVALVALAGVFWQSRRQFTQSREARVDDLRRQAYLDTVEIVYEAFEKVNDQGFAEFDESPPAADASPVRRSKALMRMAGSDEANWLLEKVLLSEFTCYHARVLAVQPSTGNGQQLIRDAINAYADAIAELEAQLAGELQHRSQVATITKRWHPASEGPRASPAPAESPE